MNFRRKLIFLNAILVLSLEANWDNAYLTQEAVVVVPVADIATKPLQSLEPNVAVDKIYEALEFSPERGIDACPRVHQIIFNEVVKVKQEVGDEVECELFNTFYETDKEKVSSFWTLKKNLVFLNKIKNITGSLDFVPQQYCDLQTGGVYLDNILTLDTPWFDTETKKYYSAGTRFVRLQDFDTSSKYAVMLFDAKDNTCKKCLIAKEFAVVDYTNKVETFVKILKKWSYKGAKKVPFVLGGCSYINLLDAQEFKLVESKRGDVDIAFWVRLSDERPRTGFDCSGLILRAAQIAGLPYFYKNTTTMAKHLRPMHVSEKLQNGDILWFHGFSIVFSDIKNNEIITSFGYASGHGVLLATEISKVFENIKTCDELVDLYHQNAPLKLLNAKGEFVREISKFIIFKLN